MKWWMNERMFKRSVRVVSTIPPHPPRGPACLGSGGLTGFGHLLTGEGSYHLSGQSLIAVTIQTTYFNIQKIPHINHAVYIYVSHNKQPSFL